MIPNIKPTPTSCRCGGDTAYVFERSDGVQVMLGCTCHTTIDSVVGLINDEISKALDVRQQQAVDSVCVHLLRVADEVRKGLTRR